MLSPDELANRHFGLKTTRKILNGWFNVVSERGVNVRRRFELLYRLEICVYFDSVIILFLFVIIRQFFLVFIHLQASVFIYFSIFRKEINVLKHGNNMHRNDVGFAYRYHTTLVVIALLIAL